MYKTVLRTYAYHFRDGFKNLYLSDWCIYFYVLVFGPISIGMVEAQFYALFVPLMLALLISRMYGGVMPKTFFLCPFSSVQRQHYAKTGIRIRIAIPLLLFIILNVLFLAFDKIPLYMFIIRAIVFVCGDISFNIYCQPVSREQNSSERKYNLSGHYGFWNMLVQIYTIVASVILCSFEYDEAVWELVLTGLMILGQLGICIKIVVRFYPQVINQATYYEQNVHTEKAEA